MYIDEIIFVTKQMGNIFINVHRSEGWLLFFVQIKGVMGNS